MKWTPEKTKRLKKFILAGYRYDEIAEKFGDGCTKNAVKSRARVCAMPRAEGQGFRRDLQ